MSCWILVSNGMSTVVCHMTTFQSVMDHLYVVVPEDYNGEKILIPSDTITMVGHAML